MIKNFVRKALLAILESGNVRYIPMWRYAERTCAICGYTGRFNPIGSYYVRPDAECPKCTSWERHRLLKLYLDRFGGEVGKKRVLHFAPEASVKPFLQDFAEAYETADLMATGVDHQWNIEEIDCADDTFDLIVCSHVLEHVDAPKALGEMHRIAVPGGHVLIMIPICEGLDETFTKEGVRMGHEAWKHFQQEDHVRLIGRDFRDLVRNAGFELSEYVAQGEEAVRYGLVMGERIFVAKKAA